MEKAQSHWYYKRVQVNAPTYNLFFELPGGLSFLLRRFHLIQPDYKTLPGPAYLVFPSVGVELTDGTGAIRWQKDAIPAQLYSAPRRNGVIMKTETAPADITGYGVNMSAIFKPRAQTINLFYDIGEQIFIRLSGMEYNAAAAQWTPDYIDLAAEGVLIP